MTVRSNIWKLFAIRFFSSLIPAYVIERLFWEQRGMTVQMVVYAEIIFAVTVVLLEIPTGIIADKWGRKRMIVLSAVLGCLEFLILVYATSFWHFALVVFLAGISRSTLSGAENAMLYDSMPADGRERYFEKLLGRLNAFDLIAAVIAAVSGSLLAARFPLELNYWLSLASMLAALGISLMLVEPAYRSSGDDPVPIGEYLSTAVLFFRKNHSVCLVVLSAILTGAAINFIDEFWQLYLSRLGIPVAFFGLFSAGMMLLRLPGSVLAYRLTSRLSYRVLLSGVSAVLAAGFFYLSVARDVTGLAAMLLICLCTGIVEPIASGYLHHRVDSSVRATVDSFQSLGLNAAVILAGLGFGYYASRFDVFGGYGFIAVVCSVFFIYFALASKKAAEKE